MMSQQGGEISFINAAIKELIPSENTDSEDKNENREDEHVGDYQSVQVGVDLKAASALLEQQLVNLRKHVIKMLEKMLKYNEKWQKEMMNEDLDMMTEDCDVMREESDTMSEELDMMAEESYTMMEKYIRDSKMMQEKVIEELKKGIIGYEQRKLQLQEDEKEQKSHESVNEREQKIIEIGKKMIELLTLGQKQADKSLLQLAEKKRKSKERSQKLIQLKKMLNDKQQRDYDVLDENFDNENEMQELTDLEQEEADILELAEIQKVPKEYIDLAKNFGEI